MYYDKEFQHDLQKIKIQNSESLLKNSGSLLISKFLGDKINKNAIRTENAVPYNTIKDFDVDKSAKQKKSPKKTSNDFLRTNHRERFINVLKDKYLLNHEKEFKNYINLAKITN